MLDAPDIVRVLASAVGDEDEQVPRYIAEPCMMAWPRILFDPLPMTFTHAARTRMSLRVQVGGEDGDAMITCENAHAMARMALKDRYGQIDHDGLDFVEYMCAQVTSAGRWTFISCYLGEYLGSDPVSDLGSTSQDAGTLDFNNYLKYLTLDDDVPEEERERCKAAWNEGIAQARPRPRR